MPSKKNMVSLEDYLLAEGVRVERGVRDAIDIESRPNFHLIFRAAPIFGPVTRGFSKNDVIDLNRRTRAGQTVYVCVNWCGFGLNFLIVQPWQIFKRRFEHPRMPRRGHEEDYCPHEIKSWPQLISIVKETCGLKALPSKSVA